MKKHFLFLLFIPFLSFSQSDKLNNYSYVIVNSKFDFVKEKDGYQTSSLTKFLFNKKGFKAFLDNEVLPEAVAENNCNALFVDVVDDSGFLKTKSAIQIKDCKNNIIYTSTQGTSKSKDYKKAYHEAIRKAFDPIAKLAYKYNGYVAEKAKVTLVETKVIEKKKKEVVKKSPKPISVTKKVEIKKKDKVKTKVEKVSVPVLYAQAKDGGYQLVNTEPKIVFTLLKTKSATKFIIKDKNGTITKQKDYWIAEYYKNGELVEEKYQIKF